MVMQVFQLTRPWRGTVGPSFRGNSSAGRDTLTVYVRVSVFVCLLYALHNTQSCVPYTHTLAVHVRVGVCV